MGLFKISESTLRNNACAASMIKGDLVHGEKQHDKVEGIRFKLENSSKIYSLIFENPTLNLLDKFILAFEAFFSSGSDIKFAKTANKIAKLYPTCVPSNFSYEPTVQEPVIPKYKAGDTIRNSFNTRISNKSKLSQVDKIRLLRELDDILIKLSKTPTNELNIGFNQIVRKLSADQSNQTLENDLFTFRDQRLAKK